MKVKNSIMVRDNHKCRICHNLAKLIHHIDYNKKNNNHENLVALCQSCHSKTNFNREHWKGYLSGGGVCEGACNRAPSPMIFL